MTRDAKDSCSALSCFLSGVSGFFDFDASKLKRLQMINRSRFSILRFSLFMIVALGIALQTGCASGPRVLPDEFDLGRASIDAIADAPPHLSPEAHDKAADVVVVSAAGAAGTGVYVGMVAALPCFFLGPYAPACFAAVVPAAATGAAVGGVAGAIHGASAADGTDTPEQSAAKREMLDVAVARLTVQELLIDRLQSRTRESARIELPVIEAKAQNNTARWRIVIDKINVAPDLADSEGAYALLASASLAVKEANSGAIAFQKSYQALSPEKRTTAEWGQDNALAARTVLDNLINALADQMYSNLSREDLTGGGILWARTHYRIKFFSRVTTAVTTKVDGIERRGEQPIQLLTGLHEVEVALRRLSYLCGYAGCLDFEQERRPFELRVEAGRSYKPFALWDCDKAWIGIVDTGRGARDDLATWQAINEWDFNDLARDAATYEVVAGEMPPETCEGQ